MRRTPGKRLAPSTHPMMMLRRALVNTSMPKQRPEVLKKKRPTREKSLMVLKKKQPMLNKVG